MQQQQQQTFNRKAVRAASVSELREAADRLGLAVSQSELESLQAVAGSFCEAYNFVDKMPDALLSSAASAACVSRSCGYQPLPADNPGNAWYWRCDIFDKEAAAASGSLLSGKTVAIKDNVCVAGVPMMNGSKLLEGYVPTEDASVVTSILRAGGRIIGKAACEDLCFSGASHTNYKGGTPNPHSEQRTCGGSSSGCGFLVARGLADVAIGGDQGGSIRIPSAWCGIVGLKPTFGLVPYTGALPMMQGIDHLGPMARSVADCGLLLEAIANFDGVDPRQPASLPPNCDTRFARAAADGCDLKQVRVAVLQEGFHAADTEVDEAVLRLADRLQAAGATVTKVTLPLHKDAPNFYLPYLLHGFAAVYAADGVSTGGPTSAPASAADALFKGARAFSADNQPITKMALLLAEHVKQHYGHSLFAKSGNWLLRLSQEYDKLLESHTVLLMPTLPFRPPGCDEGADSAAVVRHGLGMIGNTAVFNATGHPAISFNCGFTRDEKLPIGAMMVAAKFCDAQLLAVAAAAEKCIE